MAHQLIISLISLLFPGRYQQLVVSLGWIGLVRKSVNDSTKMEVMVSAFLGRSHWRSRLNVKKSNGRR